MPTKVKAQCRGLRCPNLVADKSGMCQDCRRKRYADSDSNRGTRQERGYDQAWMWLRACVLLSEPLCRECKRHGALVRANEVHHLVPIREKPQLRLEKSNLEPLCRACHQRKTNLEIRARNGNL